MMKQSRNDIALLLFVAALAYLPLVGGLGYYHDDWFTVASRVSGISLSQMHSVDRPAMGQLYDQTYRLLGDVPLAWHLLVITLRALGGLFFLWLVRLLWPAERGMTRGMALLFVVYPGFLLLPSANNYSSHLIGFTLALASLAFSVRALQSSSWLGRLGWLALAAVPVFPYERIYETLIGLEGLRLLLIVWTVMQAQAGQLRGRVMILLRRVVLWWLPTLLASLVFLYWRLVRFKSVRTATDTNLLAAQYQNDPLGMLASIASGLVNDLWQTFFAVWWVPLSQRLAGVQMTDIALALFLASAVGAALWWFERRRAQSDNPLPFAAISAALALGGLGTLVTLLPVALAGRTVEFRYNLDRYTLQSIPAVAIFCGALLALAWHYRPALGRTLLAVLVTLGVTTHLLNALQYRNNWVYQRQLWQQMIWRAPQLEPGANLVVVMPPGQRFAEGFEVWAPANLIYARFPGALKVTAEVLDSATLALMEKGGLEKRDFRTIQHTLDSDRLLVWAMDERSCLRLLDASSPLPDGLAGDDLLQRAARRSHIDLVDVNPDAAEDAQMLNASAVRALFGAELPHTWCYYYQKISLAAQRGDWAQAAALGDEAQRLGLAPLSPVEWQPLAQAYRQVGRTADAQRLGMQP